MKPLENFRFCRSYCFILILSALLPQKLSYANTKNETGTHYYKKCLLRGENDLYALEKIDKIMIESVKTSDIKLLSSIVKLQLNVGKPRRFKTIRTESELADAMKEVFTEKWKNQFDNGEGLDCNDRYFFYPRAGAIISKSNDPQHPYYITALNFAPGEGDAYLEGGEGRIVECWTEKHLVQVDQVGFDKYRYQSWSLKIENTGKPDIELSDGEFRPSGQGTLPCSGGTYIFKNKNTHYILNHMPCIGSKGSPEYNLLVEVNGKNVANWACIK
jgi:hypothetical protein